MHLPNRLIILVPCLSRFVNVCRKIYKENLSCLTTTTVKLYLAPANHYNAYCMAGYNEKDAVRNSLQGLCRERLSAYDGTAVLSHHRKYADSCDYEGPPPRRPPRWAPTITSRSRQRLSGTAQRRHRPSPPRQHALEGAGGARKAERRLHGWPGHVPGTPCGAGRIGDGAGYGRSRKPAQARRYCSRCGSQLPTTSRRRVI